MHVILTFRQEAARLSDDSGLGVREPCILDGKEEVDEKDDPGDDGEAAHGHPGRIATFVSICLDGDGPDGNEENASDEVDEELQDGEVGAQQVGDQHCRSDNRKPNDGSRHEEVVVRGVEEELVPVAPAEPRQHQHDQHEYDFKDFENASRGAKDASVQCERHV